MGDAGIAFSRGADVPGEEDAGDGDDAGEEDEREGDAVGGEVVLDAEGGDPGDAGDGLHLAGAVGEEGC